MRMYRTLFSVIACGALVTLTANFAGAQAFLPSEADIEALVETDFSGGASTTTLNSIDASGTGISLDITWDDTGEGFTRVVLQRENFDLDLSSFSSLDINFQTDDSGVGVKTFVQTGAGFAFHESPFISITPGAAQTVSLPLAGIPDVDLVQQFGFQIFGPSSGPGTVQVFGVVPEPSSVLLLTVGCATLLGMRRRA